MSGPFGDSPSPEAVLAVEMPGSEESLSNEHHAPDGRLPHLGRCPKAASNYTIGAFFTFRHMEAGLSDGVTPYTRPQSPAGRGSEASSIRPPRASDPHQQLPVACSLGCLPARTPRGVWMPTNVLEGRRTDNGCAPGVDTGMVNRRWKARCDSGIRLRQSGVRDLRDPAVPTFLRNV
eukprot:scaffold3581_cov417-Prasinococcus_capsulatus_cf.AAC.9